jgi:hypothetical protein
MVKFTNLQTLSPITIESTTQHPKQSFSFIVESSTKKIINKYDKSDGSIDDEINFCDDNKISIKLVQITFVGFS